MANISELRVYKDALNFSNQIWDICLKWDYFVKKTIGDQLVRSADSISANLAEGYGRFYIKENIHFCYYSRGSLEETKDWLRKANSRNLISNQSYQQISEQLTQIAKQLNSYIASLKKKANSK